MAKRGEKPYNRFVPETRAVPDVPRLMESLGELPEPVASPTLVVVSGLPGTGKSYFSRKLAERLPFVVLESDALRKVLFPQPVYSAEESLRLFRAIHRLIEQLLKRGIRVILDATNLAERYREPLYSIADRLGVKIVLVQVEAPDAVVRERLSRTEPGTRGESEAGWDIYERMKTSLEKIKRKHYVVDTSRDLTPVLDKIVREVTR